MVTKEVVYLSELENENSLDSGRVVALLIQKASTYVSDVRLEVDGRRANAKSLLGVMSLALDRGSNVTISASGADEDEALEDLAEYLTNPSAE